MSLARTKKDRSEEGGGIHRRGIRLDGGREDGRAGWRSGKKVLGAAKFWRIRQDRFKLPKVGEGKEGEGGR